MGMQPRQLRGGLTITWVSPPEPLVGAVYCSRRRPRLQSDWVVPVPVVVDEVEDVDEDVVEAVDRKVEVDVTEHKFVIEFVVEIPPIVVLVEVCWLIRMVSTT